MVIAYHVCFSTYGFWLPNDPRGSNSDSVRAPHIRAFGEPTKVATRRSVAHAPHDRAARLLAKQAMWFEPVRLTGKQAQAVGIGFAKYVAKSHIVIRACAILPCHVHLVIDRHDFAVEQIVNLLKGSATRELVARHLFPAPVDRSPRVWARGCRKVFLNTDADVLRTIDYVNRNPIKDGKRRQKWSFVQ